MGMRDVAPAAEVVCADLFNSDYTHLGDSNNGEDTWFFRGERPHSTRVQVHRSTLAPVVTVHVETRNVAIPGAPQKVRKTFTISCTGSSDEILRTAKEVSVRVLQQYADMLVGQGDHSEQAAREAIAHRREHDV